MRTVSLTEAEWMAVQGAVGVAYENLHAAGTAINPPARKAEIAHPLIKAARAIAEQAGQPMTFSERPFEAPKPTKGPQEPQPNPQASSPGNEVVKPPLQTSASTGATTGQLNRVSSGPLITTAQDTSGKPIANVPAGGSPPVADKGPQTAGVTGLNPPPKAP